MPGLGGLGQKGGGIRGGRPFLHLTVAEAAGSRRCHKEMLGSDYCGANIAAV